VLRTEAVHPLEKGRVFVQLAAGKHLFLKAFANLARNLQNLRQSMH
jgi:hypothetical protein